MVRNKGKKNQKDHFKFRFYNENYWLDIVCNFYAI